MLNKVILIGNLGTDVETKYMPNGTAVATISLATSRSWVDKQSGERKDDVEWHRVTMFGKLAEIAGQYLKKGSKVYIEGRIKTTKWQKDGVDQYSTDIISDVMKMLDSKQEGGQSSQETTLRKSKPVPSKIEMDYQGMPSDVDNFDDTNIPF